MGAEEGRRLAAVPVAPSEIPWSCEIESTIYRPAKSFLAAPGRSWRVWSSDKRGQKYT